MPHANWSKLNETIAKLRAPDGCPWDREQTHRSLVPYLIEESFELAEAIEGGNDAAIVEELGDVLLQVILHAQIASETDRFDIEDVAGRIAEKMIHRHPHVFGDAAKEMSGITSDQVLMNWHQLKSKEKQLEKPVAEASKLNPLDFRFDIPIGMPALSRSAKIGEKTKRHRFDWPNWQGVFEKIHEELGEVHQAMKEAKDSVFDPKSHPETGPAQDPVGMEIGDLLFSVAQLARHRGLDPEQCLREANARFEKRFGILKSLESDKGRVDGRNWESRSTDEIEALWKSAKIVVAEKTKHT